MLDSSLYSRSEVEMLPSLDSHKSEHERAVVDISLITHKLTSILFLAGVFERTMSTLLGDLLQVGKKSFGSVLDIPGKTEPRHPLLCLLPGLARLRAVVALSVTALGH